MLGENDSGNLSQAVGAKSALNAAAHHSSNTTA
jgi:hypothetical protein